MQRQTRNAVSAPVFVDPDIGASAVSYLVEVLEGPVELGVELVAHKEAAEGAWEVRPEASAAALHEAANERGRDSRELMVGEAPIAAAT